MVWPPPSLIVHLMQKVWEYPSLLFSTASIGNGSVEPIMMSNYEGIGFAHPGIINEQDEIGHHLVSEFTKTS